MRILAADELSKAFFGDYLEEGENYEDRVGIFRTEFEIDQSELKPGNAN